MRTLKSLGLVVFIMTVLLVVGLGFARMPANASQTVGPPITLADGTLIAPALAFGSDPATGAYYTGSHSFALVSNSVSKVSVGSTVTVTPVATFSAGLVSTGAITANGGITAGAGSNITLDSGTATASSGAATLNKQAGIITTEALTTAAQAAYTLTLTDSVITTTSRIGISVANGTSTTGIPVFSTVAPGAGSAVIIVYNLHATAALNGTLKIAFNVWL